LANSVALRAKVTIFCHAAHEAPELMTGSCHRDRRSAKTEMGRMTGKTKRSPDSGAPLCGRKRVR